MSLALVLRRLALVLPLALLMVAGQKSAYAQSKEECVEAHVRAQSAAREGKLLEARRQALACMQGDCPGVLQSECVEFLQRIERDTPTVALRVRDAGGNDLLDVEVRVDGQVLAHALDGTSVPLDPGRHHFEFRAPRMVTVERTVLVVAGQKNQLVEVVLKPPAEHLRPQPRPQTVDPAPDPMLVGGLVMAGVGVAGLIVLAGVGGAALAERADLEQRCSPDCSDEEVGALKTKRTVADASLGIGATAAAIGAVLIAVSLSREPAHGASGPRPPLALGAVPLAGGAALAIRGTF